MEVVDGRGGQTLDLQDIMPISLKVTADLGKTAMKVKDILDLKVGSVVSLDKMAGEMTDVYVNGLHVARGEAVVIGDTLHVRLSEIVGVNEVEEG
ncbi:MAG: flagellar motor switch protein FliN [Candidatus Hydrogenedentota bacterium]|nr:MAG: flagellar motor switch protein FliN [Candidatus Hydrogenedentota bacterium]